MKINLTIIRPLLAAPMICFAFVAASFAFDIDKCISSCDMQYSNCVKNTGGTADGIKYCSNQHDACRKACMEHK